MNTEFTQVERDLIEAIDAFCDECHAASVGKGFWKDYDNLVSLVSSQFPQGLKALEGLMIGQKLALMHSELSEALEGSRKDLGSDKLPGFTAEEEEIADAIIRAGDFAGKRRLRLGLAIVLKLRYNAGRPYMHGKNF